MMKHYIIILVFLIISIIFLPACTCGGGGGYYYEPPETQSPPSVPETQSPPPVPPNAPYNLTAVAISQSIVNLQWMDNSDNEEGFMIYRGDNLVATVGVNVTTYQDSGLEPATTYQYVVKAYNQAGESGTISYMVRTLNPAIRVMLDRIGVYFDHDPFLRGAGEIYLGIVVTDGEKIEELKLPPQAGGYYILNDNETWPIGVQVFSTNEVGDYLRVCVIAYEADGGDFEQFIYQALAMAVAGYITGGTGISILAIFELNLGELIGNFFGQEDDFVGSYEQAWNQSTYWGIGSYSDVPCEDLRLWFTIESPR